MNIPQIGQHVLVTTSWESTSNQTRTVKRLYVLIGMVENDYVILNMNTQYDHIVPKEWFEVNHPNKTLYLIPLDMTIEHDTNEFNYYDWMVCNYNEQRQITFPELLSISELEVGETFEIHTLGEGEIKRIK
jgi:hypothetical protein